MAEAHELLLTWISERGSGTWSSFRKAHDWLLNKGRGEATLIRPFTTATTMAILGQMEMDWKAKRWGAAPPILTIVPSAGAHALLTGGRTRALVGQLDELTSADETQDLMQFRMPQRAAPDAIHIASDDETRVQALASKLDIHYEYCIAERLAEMLPQIQDVVNVSRSTLAPEGFEVQRWRPSDFQWATVNSDSSDGLYKYGLHGSFKYRFSASGDPFELDLPTGIYAELKRTGRNVLQYERETVNGILKVPWNVPLPVLQARTAALCSGLAPRSNTIDKVYSYFNVPSAIAAKIASSLGQVLRST